MELTKEQNDALKILIDRYRSGAAYSVLAGYAGVGKSTCIKFLVDYLLNSGLNEEDIAFCAYTGKAVQVMIDKGNKNAITLHKLLYKPVPQKDGRFYFKPKDIGSLPYKLILIDEVSMVPASMVEQLLRHRVHVIFMGDPGQLPPISKTEDNHLLDNPNAMLTTIHRQAQDSGIIQLSMLIREGKPFKNFKSKDALVLPQKELTTGALLWADEILCATNATRKNINSQVRELKGYTKPVEENEKLICLNNEWDILSDNENALTNGTIGTLSNVFESFQQYPAYFPVPGGRIPLVGGKFKSDNGDEFGNLLLDKTCILTGDSHIDGATRYRISRDKKFRDTLPLSFTYAYCLTTHKSQGSSWGQVLGIEEGFPYDKEEHKKFLYTLVTRSENKVVLFTKE